MISSASGPAARAGREAVGLFNDSRSYAAAVEDLLHHGFSCEDLSVRAGQDPLAAPGIRYRSMAEAEDDARAPRAGFYPREGGRGVYGAALMLPIYLASATALCAILASGGTPLAAFVGAAFAGACGAAPGALLAWLVSSPHGRDIRAQLEHGGVILWVRVRSARDEAMARKILGRHFARDIHLHRLPA